MASPEIIPIACPKCKKKYRVDRKKIPTSGVILQCKACHAKFRLSRSAPAQKTMPDKCPKCGFAPINGDRCYQCGVIFRKALPKSDLPGEAKAEIPYCEIIIEMQFNPSLFFLIFTKPNIIIEGESSLRKWGRHVFRFPAGKYHIEIEYLYLPGVKSGHANLTVDLKNHQSALLLYDVPAFSHLSQGIFKIKKIKDMPKIYFESINIKTDDESRFLQPIFIIGMLLFMFPLGAYLLNKSSQFTSNLKTILYLVFGTIFFITMLYLMMQTPFM